MKLRLRLLVVGALVAVLAVGGWLLARNAMARREAALTRSTIDLLPNVAQRIQNFHRVKVEDGRKVWEVAAREAQYLESEETVVVSEPLLSLYLKDGRTVALRGHGGKVFLDGRELDRVELDGDIEVTLGDYALRTDQARYEAASDRIIAPGEVHISGSDFEVHGERMEVEVGAQRLTLTKRIDMTLWPKT